MPNQSVAGDAEALAQQEWRSYNCASCRHFRASGVVLRGNSLGRCWALELAVDAAWGCKLHDEVGVDWGLAIPPIPQQP